MAKTAGKIIAWVIVILLLVGAAFGYYKFFWVFSDGTKTGELNSLTYTGYIWKTYEGEMILSGYGAKGSVNGSVQSKIFKFSVSDKPSITRNTRAPSPGAAMSAPSWTPSTTASP